MIEIDNRSRSPSSRVSNEPTIPTVRDRQPTTNLYVIIRNRNVDGPLVLRDRESYVTCPYCQNRSCTRIEFAPTWRTHLIAALLCLFGCWCCACTPYLVESCVNIKHYCGNCDRYIGTYTSRDVVQIPNND